jgi:hypothetical protein
MADLFQNKSNGDLELNNTETTEYLEMVLSAVKIADSIEAGMTSFCEGGKDKDEPEFSTKCFNKNFFPILLKNYNQNFPRLNDYLTSKNTSDEEKINYLLGVEGFSRDNPDPKIPIGKRDTILIIGAMLNIESTFMRFDFNKDNKIDYDELSKAYQIYRSAIITLAELKPSEEKYAKSIFLYMVTKMEYPSTGTITGNAEFLAFHECVSVDICRNTFMDKIEAKRVNVAKLLSYIVSQP